MPFGPGTVSLADHRAVAGVGGSFWAARMARLGGLEGEVPRVIEPAMARRVYLESFRRHRRLLQEAAQGLRVEFQEIVTDRPLLDAIRLVLSRHNQRQSHQKCGAPDYGSRR
jgi:hypothetical protein